MMRLSTLTWWRFAIWCSFGLIIYFGYGMSNSELSGQEPPQQQAQQQTDQFSSGIDNQAYREPNSNEQQQQQPYGYGDTDMNNNYKLCSKKWKLQCFMNKKKTRKRELTLHGVYRDIYEPDGE